MDHVATQVEPKIMRKVVMLKYHRSYQEIKPNHFNNIHLVSWHLELSRIKNSSDLRDTKCPAISQRANGMLLLDEPYHAVACEKRQLRNVR